MQDAWREKYDFFTEIVEIKTARISLSKFKNEKVWIVMLIVRFSGTCDINEIIFLFSLLHNVDYVVKKKTLIICDRSNNS